MKQIKCLRFLVYKAIGLFLGVLLLISPTWAQDTPYVEKIEYPKVPRSVSKSPSKLAKYLTQQDTSDYQKVHSMYTWIINSITYDLKSSREANPKYYTVSQTLKRKKGICYQYSELFVALCQKVGISAKEIIGYSKGAEYHEDNQFYESDHSWNAVKLDSTWHLLDATWGSGYQVAKKQWFRELLYKWFKKPYLQRRYTFVNQPNYNYFLSPPEKFIIKHLPADPHWQLLEFPIAVSTFESEDWVLYIPQKDSVYKRQVDDEIYRQHLDAYEFLYPLDYQKRTAEHSLEYNPKNHQLMGYSWYNRALVYAKEQGNISQSLAAQEKALKGVERATHHLKKHRQSAITEARRARNTSLQRIRKELKQPLSQCTMHAKQELREAEYCLESFEKTQKSHESQMASLQGKINSVPRRFRNPPSARVEKREQVRQNDSIIGQNMLLINACLDSVKHSREKIIKFLSARKKLQGQMLSLYQELPGLCLSNVQAIQKNYSFFLITQTMQLVGFHNISVDGLRNQRKGREWAIRQEKAKINQYQASMYAWVSQIKQLVLKNCELSQNQYCEKEDIFWANRSMKKVYRVKLGLEKAYHRYANYDREFSQKIKPITQELLEITKGNAKFIELYRQKRENQISRRLYKSKSEMAKMIANCESLSRLLKQQIAELKSYLRKEEKLSSQQ